MIEEQVKYSNEWARSNRELLFNKSLAGIALRSRTTLNTKLRRRTSSR